MRFLLTLLFVLTPATPAWAQLENVMVRLKLNGLEIEGSPLTFSAKEVNLLARDGHLWTFSPQDATDFSKTAEYFQSYSHGELRGSLQREFGDTFEVSGAGQYLVVHPRGQGQKWAPRFEELYRNFIHYFTARGLTPETPKFPLIAVVCHKQEDFIRTAARDGVTAGSGLLGYYLPSTNRILLYDVTDGRNDKADWHTNAETIIHEAAHQVAFNTGVHSRYAMPPRWLAEGLGTLFEARGVWNSRENTKLADRLNRGRLKDFQALQKVRPTGWLAEFVSSDRPFQTNVGAAYAEAWALTFFLTETEPRKYTSYLVKTATREHFSQYSPQERLRDFCDVFGNDLKMLEARYLRFIAELQ